VIAQALLRQASKGDVRAIADDCGSSPFERKHRVTYHDSVDADVHSICSNSQRRSCEIVDVLASSRINSEIFPEATFLV